MTQIRRRQRQGFLFAESLRQIMADRILRPGIAQGVRGKFPLQPISANLRVEPSEECDASVPR